MAGGLSRRGSFFEDEVPEAVYQYASVPKAEPADDDDAGKVQIPKAKSDAALANQARLVGPGVQMRKKHHKRSRTGGSTTPALSKSRSRTADDDWLTHTSATANALLLESKGHTWLTTRMSSTNLVIASDDDDEGYEEMAALSATTAKLQTVDSEGQATPRPEKWGSRFGSRRTSRRGSLAGGARTPLAPSDDYFNQATPAAQPAPVFVEDSEDDTEGEAELTELTKDRSFGLGPVVDRLMSNLFSLPEGEETGTETGNESETPAEARARRVAEAKRRQQEKERLVAPPAPKPGDDDDKVGLWQDAGWLLGVASRVLS